MGGTLFVLAAALAVFSILFIYKKHLQEIKDDPTLLEKVQQKFFISTAIAEALPVILIIIGAIYWEGSGSAEALVMPTAVMIFLMIYAIIFIFLQTRVDVDESNKKPVRQFSLIAVMLVLAIPLVALVMMIVAGDI